MDDFVYRLEHERVYGIKIEYVSRIYGYRLVIVYIGI